MAFEQIYELLNKYDGIQGSNVKERIKDIEKFKKEIDYPNLIQDINQLTFDICSGISRTVEIIKGLRTFSRLDETDLKTIDLHKSLDSTLVLLRNKYSGRIEIVKEYGEIPFVECFPGKINQVFLNIIVNAIQATKHNGMIFISTNLLSANDIMNVIITIRDTGEGMTEAVKKKIFEPFFTTKDAGEGTGLGLSITYSVIENHHGSIEVESKPGRGATFKIILPVIYKKKEKTNSNLN